VFYARVAILNTQREVLQNRSKWTSDRPPSRIVGDLMAIVPGFIHALG